MLGSLRFRLPALFLVGIVVSGVIAAAVALALFQNYARQQLLTKLRREANGLTQLYQKQAIAANDTGARTLRFAPPQLERATGDKIFYVGADVFPDQVSGLRQLPQSSVDWRSGQKRTLEFRPPGFKRTYLAVLQPMRLAPHSSPFGALVVATPKTEITSGLQPLAERLGLAFIGGILVAGLLGWYLSRRITRPVLALSGATDEISRGHYDVAVPDVPGGGEIGHLAQRFGEMAKRLDDAEQQERNFLMSVSHELRTPLTAIRGHVDALREGVAADPVVRAASLDMIASETARLERLVGDVLDLAKLEAHRFTLLKEEVDMGRLLDQAYASFGEEARRRESDYRCEIDARPVIVSDGDRVLQIISNLLANAFRWTPDGGSVALALAAENGN
ncbi:MAG: histidine kinase dimerization/phospho-acceptor domain-containing protein, partial [Gaiellaceae bacterium]